MSQSNLKKNYNNIKNNSYINLGYGNHIRIVWSCRNAEKKLNVNIFHKILVTSLPVAKTLIKYKSNNLEENDEEEKEPIDIELTEQKINPYNDENDIDFKWSDVKEEEDIALTSFIESLQ